MAFLRAALLCQTTLALLRGPDVQRGDWISSDNTVCKYEIHLHGGLSKVRATPFNILFRSDNVLVIEGEGGLRHLAFRDKGGGCHEQTRVVCHPQKQGASFLMGPSAKVTEKDESPDRCLKETCNADPGDFALSLVRVMIAASIGPRPNAKNIAIVGLGGGMIPLWFKEKRPSIDVDAADISSGVVASVHCFGLFNETNMNLHHEDGRKFLQRQEMHKYDAIMVDAFDDKDNIPPCLRTIEFFNMVKSRLNQDGGLVMNTWRKNLDVMLPALQTVFDVVLVGKSPGLGNIIVHATSSSVKLPLPPSAKNDDSFFGDSFFHKKAVRKGLNGETEGPAQWLANLEFIHPPKGWVLYPQYHRDGPTTPPPIVDHRKPVPTAKPLFTEYKKQEMETDAQNECHYD